MNITKSTLAWITVFHLATSFVAWNAQAQNTTLSNTLGAINTAGNNLFSVGAQVPNFTGANNQAVNSMQSCAAKAATDQGVGIAKQFGGDPAASSKDAAKGCDGATDPVLKALLGGSGANLCKKSLPAADSFSPQACDKYVDTGGETTNDKNTKLSGHYNKRYKDDLANAKCYSTLAQSQDDSCGLKGMADFQAQYNLINCQMGVLAQAESMAAQQVTQAMSANSAQYTKLVQIQTELNDQKTVVDQILGPDPELGGSGSAQTGGLLALQKTMQAHLDGFKNTETDFTNKIAQIKEDTLKNEQTLQADTLQVVTSCLNGERNLTVGGSQPLLCYKPQMAPVPAGSPAAAAQPVMGSNGKPVYVKQPCGPLEYVRSQVEQSAYITGRGVLISADRQDESQAKTARFDSVMQAILRDMGSYDTANASGDRLQTNIQTIGDFNKKYGSVLAQLGADVGFPNLAANIENVTQHCFAQSQTWQKQQRNSPSSAYRLKATQLTAGKTELTDGLMKGLAALNTDYQDVIGTLTGKHVALNRYSCTTNDMDKMEACFKQIEGNLSDLLEGNGKNTFVAKTIEGGSFVGPISFTCNGINGCVTDYLQIRKIQIAAIKKTQQQRVTWVNQGNQAIQTGMTQFAQGLGQLQNSILSQYDTMKKSLLAMGVTGDVPDKPNFKTSEALTPQVTQLPPDGKVSENGPFQNPKDMAAALSTFVQPSGLIDFNNPNFKAALAAVNETVKANKEKMDKKVDEASSMYKKFSEMDCSKDFNINGSGTGRTSASVSSDYCENCRKKANGCENILKGRNDSGNYASQIKALASLMDDTKKSSGKSSEDLNLDLSSISGLDGINEKYCSEDALKVCEQCDPSGKSDTYSGDGTDPNDNTATKVK